jgi:carboxymethylenebutenolidase
MATHYDPDAPDEILVQLPSSPLITLGAPNTTLQPPLSRRGHGPGILMFLPPSSVVPPMSAPGKKSLDPAPQMKWAEEGFAVTAITCEPVMDQIQEALRICIDALVACDKVDVKDKFAVIST